jgi:hypothetical protein
MTASQNTTIAPAVQSRGARPRRRRPPSDLRLTRARRERMEALISDMLQILDELDGDADDEPSLGGGFSQNGLPYDAEGEDDSGIADQDGLSEQLRGESSLGWTKDINQTRALRRGSVSWPASLVDDAEAEHGGREPDADLEPSLGFQEALPGAIGGLAFLPDGSQVFQRFNGMDQRSIAQGNTEDREGDDDNGVADQGGADEQWGAAL